ncbi:MULTISPECIES: 3-keto-5-aminohexanoate cleavage protein [Streptomyces]|uniref:3-keto-5-aminohexanoate cleavage protein n=1 Tax=Streptomyces TaxID=1883 RepID=UPI001C2FDDA2|nr:3-keto-5-aminohexanoate cleavage protein [Streptomyces sp. GbtcB7]
MFDLTKDLKDLPSRAQALAERGARELDAPPPPDVQPRWDIPDVVVVTAAISGRVTREAATGTPRSFPLDFDSFVQTSVDVIEAGAAGVHIDFGGIAAIQESGLSVPDCYDKVIGDIRDKTSHDWIPDCNVLRGQNLYENVYPITSGLTETVPIAPNFPVDWMETVATLVGQNNQRLFFSIHSAAEVDLANRFVYSRGLAGTPACWLILIGYQYDDATDRLAAYLAHPRAMLDELTLIVDRIREIDPHGFIQVCAAGRAGHYMATAAMLLGLHVRVGTEDTVWRYPHRDEVVENNVEMVHRVRATAESLGRRLATPAEFRKLIGLDQPEPAGTAGGRQR